MAGAIWFDSMNEAVESERRKYYHEGAGTAAHERLV
jgi:hypothetical protein